MGQQEVEEKCTDIESINVGRQWKQNDSFEVYTAMTLEGLELSSTQFNHPFLSQIYVKNTYRQTPNIRYLKIKCTSFFETF